MEVIIPPSDSGQIDEIMSGGQDGFLSRPKAEWTPTRDAYLVELLIEQHNSGRTAYNEFKNEVIKCVTRDFNRKFSLKLEENQIKNRYNVMKKDYGVVKILLSHKGFGWDETRQMVVADDQIWDNYIPIRCEARPFRRKSFPLYKQMSILFEGERGIPKCQFLSGAMATAEEGNSNTETIRSSEPCNVPAQVILDGTLNSDSDSDSDSMIIRINDDMKTKKKRKSANPAYSNDKKRAYHRIGETIESALYEVFLAAKSRAKQKKKNGASSDGTTRLYQKCLEELQKLEELDDNEFAKGVNALKDDKNAIAFMTIKGHRRLTWLRSLWHHSE
ncbi:uncharacterized protein G2W53_003466 [Senna tora]|uniref:Myb/SANT-like domain-containing protein n=1 Tax=Senna tora TaxID=362788 RepID=A0A834XDL0_9FABA|nr:uncharacterized protein G2W53_003466 [Senna tora]